MTVTLMPDVEKILWVFLNDQSEVTDMVGDRIYKAAIPDNPVAPLVKLSRVSGDTLVGWPLALDEARVQVDVYGGSQRLANRIAETIRAVCVYRLTNYTHEDGVIQTAYADPPIWQPETEGWTGDQGGPRPRYIVDIVVTTRPPSPVATP